MGKHDLRNQYRNGELFVDLCAREDMVIGGTLFPHKTAIKLLGYHRIIILKTK
jgi:hypothetical protein